MLKLSVSHRGNGGNVVDKLRWPLVTVLAVCVVLPALAEDIGWQEAIARLAYERTMAETCVKALKIYGKNNEHAIQGGEIAYDNARAEYNGIIAGLIVALARKADPPGLPDVEARMKRGFEAREAFCKSVQPLVPPEDAGQKGVIKDIVSGAVGPMVDAVKAIWMRVRDDDALMRRVIENQLEATSWPPFASISPSS
jgi:hypothetical protein